MDLLKIPVFITLCTAAVSARAALTDYELQPSAHRTVSSLATVKITFPEAKFLGMYGSPLNGVTLTSKSDPSVVYEPCNISYSTFFSSNSETFSLKRAGSADACVVSEPGEYVLHFPAQCFELCGDWYSHLGYSDEINVTYTVGEAGGGYDSYFDPATVFVRPVPGDIMEFKDITIMFPVNEQYPTVDIIEPGLITMRKEGADAPEYVLNGTAFDDEGTVSLNFRRSASAYPHAEYIYEPGEYTVDIPAGVFRLTSTDIVNDRMLLKYNVTGANAASGQLRRFELTPQAGTVDRIECITLEYPDLTEELFFPDCISDITDYVAGRITLKRLNADPDLCSVYEPYSAILTGNNRVELRFRNRVASGSVARPETITRQGDYQLTVLPNTFKLKSNNFAFNARVEAYYTISRDVSSDPMASFMLSPADGEELGSLTSMSVTFPEATEGLVFPIDRTGITLVNVDDESDIYEARNLMLQGNKVTWKWNRPDFIYDEGLAIEREGDYRLTIKAGTMRSYSNPEYANGEICAVYHLSPDNEFSYTLTPEPGRAYTRLPEIRISAADGVSGLRPTGAAGAPATLREASGTEYTLPCGDDCVFDVPSELPAGNYTLTVPEAYFVETNRQGKNVYSKKISAVYRIAAPAHYEASLVPASGSTVSGLTSVSVTPTGAELRSFGIDPEAGTPTFAGNGTVLYPEAGVSAYGVAFILPDDTVLAPGLYTLSIPAGYITVVDGNGLSTSLDAVVAEYTVARGALPEFDGGIFFLNEGAFGSAFSSLSYLENDMATMHYRVFSEANSGRTPGVTAQYGCLHGQKLYLMSKQASYSDRSSLFTVADARTLAIERQVSLDDAAGRSICPVDDKKVYIGTSDGIYVYDAESGTADGRIPGTETGAGLYQGQTGDMVRLGEYVFAAVQGRGVYVVDTAHDLLVATVALPEVSGVFVTGGGLLFASADNSEAPFVRIDPETFRTEPLAAGAVPVASQWRSWRSLPLTAAIRGNRVFYVTDDESATIASYDFDSADYDPRRIMLPASEGIAMKTYGTALSTEPESGYVMVCATGGSGNYDRNAIYFADPSDGRVMEPLTVYPERGYWFPAMALHTIGRGPDIASGISVSVAAGSETALDLTEITYLSAGNPHLIVYTAEVSDPEVCSLERAGNGHYILRGRGEGTAQISVAADYRGIVSHSEISVTVSDDTGISDPDCGTASRDVLDISGRVILRNATPDRIGRLPRGFYIIGGKKTFIL